MRALPPLLILLAGCPDPDRRPLPDDTDPDTDTGADTEPDTEPVAGCFDSPPAADRDRVVVVSHPYGEGGSANDYATLTLAADGALTPTGARFQMGRAFFGPIRFSRDGRLGVAVQDDGTLGVFRVEDGEITVVHERFGRDAFYASDVVFDPAGERLWVVDGNWRNNGGGLYAVDLDCETGALTPPTGPAIASKRASTLIRRPGAGAILVARDVGASGTGDAHVVDLEDGAVASTANLFSDEDAVYGGAALVGGAWLLVGDYSVFSGVPNRVAVARVSGDALEPTQVLSPIEDPVAIAASPWGNAALVSSGFADEIVLLRRDGETWSSAGAVAGSPLPSGMATVDTGALRGLVLVAENLGVRRVRFDEEGAATDLGATPLGTGLTAIVGAVGVQP